jgi:hypothetical protein
MLFAGTILAALPAAGSESLRQFHAETLSSPDEIVARLEPRLLPSVTVTTVADDAILSYTGNAPPAALTDFVESTFDALPEGFLIPGRTLSLALTISGRDGGADLSLLLLARFPEPPAPLPDGAVVLLDGRGAADCTGQMVLRHPGRHRDVAKSYREHLEEAGFAFPDAEPDETSFFIGYAPDCAAALYLRPDQGTTLIVVRYLED